MSDNKDFNERFNCLEESIHKLIFSQKTILTLQEATQYLGISSSHLYKLTSKNRIHHYKPEGKLIFFKREDLDAWMLSNPVKTIEEIKESVNNYQSSKGNLSNI